MSRLHIGTSGWNYEHWKGPFYPKDLAAEELLAHYAGTFSCTEVNSTFYGLPDRKSIDQWLDATPDAFTFATKASRYLTHMKKLNEPREALDRFLEVADWFGNRLGPLLYQLPPNWKANLERLETFLQMLPKERRHVFEFRDHSWLTEECAGLLEKHGAGFCIYELEGFTTSKRTTSDFAYLRLHGPGKAYQGSYDDQSLQGWAGAISAWMDKGLDVYCFFDNDQKGYAPRNASKLLEMLS